MDIAQRVQLNFGKIEGVKLKSGGKNFKISSVSLRRTQLNLCKAVQVAKTRKYRRIRGARSIRPPPAKFVIN